MRQKRGKQRCRTEDRLPAQPLGRVHSLLGPWPCRLPLEQRCRTSATRGVAVGRRNWTFAGSDTGGNRAAAVYTLIETALCRIPGRSLGLQGTIQPLALDFTDPLRVTLAGSTDGCRGRNRPASEADAAGSADVLLRRLRARSAWTFQCDFILTGPSRGRAGSANLNRSLSGVSA